jgi:glycosyltransferase involved in cell wall biosynthesis
MAVLSNSHINLSIALVTRNRAESLARTLQNLREQDVQPFEVIISDDSDVQGIISINKELAQKYGCKYVTGPFRGLYANRNFVAKHCSGTHIRTMDDDHEFPVGHIRACLEAIESDRDAIWTIGEFYPSDQERLLPAPIPGQLHPRGFSFTPSNINEYYGISCGASIYPRSVVDNNIMNLETYRFGLLYLEYGARLFNHGYRIKFLDTTYILHDYDENNRSINCEQTISSARLFSMFMLSFYHKRSIRNILLTLIQVSTELIRRYYSLSLALSAYFQYKKEVKSLRIS